MAHKALIGGTAYGIKGGKTMVNGTAYSIKKGRTLVGGTGYDINFSTPVRLTVYSEADYVFVKILDVRANGVEVKDTNGYIFFLSEGLAN